MPRANVPENAERLLDNLIDQLNEVTSYGQLMKVNPSTAKSSRYKTGMCSPSRLDALGITIR